MKFKGNRLHLSCQEEQCVRTGLGRPSSYWKTIYRTTWHAEHKNGRFFTHFWYKKLEKLGSEMTNADYMVFVPRESDKNGLPK